MPFARIGRECVGLWLPARRVRGGVRRAGAGPLLAPCGGLVCKWMGVASATHAPPGHPHPRSGRAKCRTSNPPIDRIEATPRTSSAGQPRHRRGSRARYSLSLRFHPPTPRTIHPTHLKPLQPWPTTSSETASSSTGRAPLRASQPLRAVSCDRPRSLFGVAKLPRPARFIGDLAVKDGLITEVGTKLATTGAREIDATGKHVCSHTPLLQLFACRPRGCSLALFCG